MTRSIRRVSVALLMVGAMTAGPWLFTSALYTDDQVVPSQTFATGTLDIATTPTSGVVSFGNMAPGDRITAPLVVSNEGSLDLRYAMVTGITGDVALADALIVSVKTGLADCSDAGFGAAASVIYSGSLSAASVGDAAEGAQAGDRQLGTGTQEELCFQVELPRTSDNATQGLTTTATFTFHAEQIRNNP